MKLTVRQLKNIIRETIFESSSGIKASLDAWDDGGTAEVGLRGEPRKAMSRSELAARLKASLDAWDDGGTAEVGLRGDRGKPRSRAERIASLQAALDDYGEGFDPTRGHGLY